MAANSPDLRRPIAVSTQASFGESELRIQMLESTLQACVDEYADDSEIHSNLDAKAQNTTTIAGIFLAAAFAFLQGDNVAGFVRLASKYSLILLGLAIVLLLASIAVCVFSMRIRTVTGRLRANTVAGMVQNILDHAPVPADETIENYLWDQINAWRQALDSISADNASKAQTVFVGQLLLGMAVILVAVLLLVILYNVGLSPIV